MADTRSLAEWTLTLRKLTETDEPGLWGADEMLCDDSTRIHLRTVANPEAMTVDYSLRVGPGRAPLDDLPVARRGRTAYLWGAVDQHGDVLDILRPGYVNAR